MVINPKTIFTALSLSLSISVSSTSFAGDEIDDAVTRAMANRQIPGIAIGIVKPDQSTVIRAYGFANLETKTPMKTTSIFSLASVTKQFTSTAIMKLVEEGKLSLEDNLCQFVEDCPADWALIKVRHLLSHQTGLADQIIAEHEGQVLMDVRTPYYLDKIKKSTRRFKAGEKAAYSDPGYFLLGVILEKVTGLKYGKFLKQEIFDPSGMTTAQMQNQWQIMPDRVGHYHSIRGELNNARRDYQFDLNPHFGVMSNIEDMVKWEQSIRSKTVLNKTSFDRMWSNNQTNDGGVGNINGVPYGFGWFLGDYNGQDWFEHGGSTGTHFLRYPDKNISIIVLTNLMQWSGSNPKAIAHEIAGLLDDDLKQPHQMTKAQPNPEMVTLLLETLNDVKNEKIPDPFTAAFKDTWRGAPKMWLADMRRKLSGKLAVAFIGCQDKKKATKDSIKACHFEVTSSSTTQFYTLKVTPSFQISRLSSYTK